MSLAALLLGLALPALAEGPPRLVAVQGGCPDQCCTYGAWRATRSVKLFAEAGSSRAVGVVKEDDAVEAREGVLLIRPRKVKVVMQSLYDSTMPRGEALYLINRLVDGSWRVWYKGAFVDGVREIWDPVESGKVKGAWWVRVQAGDGVSGWTKDAASFEGSRQTNCQAGN